MELDADTVSTDFADNRISICIDIIMHCLPHVAEEAPRFYLFETFEHCFLCDINEFLLLRADITDTEHTGRVGEIAVQDCRAVYVDDITGF